MKITRGERAFSWINNVFLLLVGLLCLLPYLTLLAKSFSSEAAVVSGSVLFWPKGINVTAYSVLIRSGNFLIAFKNSVTIVLLGTTVHVFFTLCVGYFCSRDYIPGSRAVMRLYVFSMLFSGGTIPTFMVIKWAGLMNNLLVMVLPFMVGTFNLLMARGYFYTIPDSLEESAKIDGASNLRVFFQIMLPMAVPIVATITIFTAVSIWNNYLSPLMYLGRNDVKVLSVYLRDIVSAADLVSLEGTEAFDTVATESFRAAAIFVSTAPIIIVYPFLQKYFIVGMKIGAIKE